MLKKFIVAYSSERIDSYQDMTFKTIFSVWKHYFPISQRYLNKPSLFVFSKTAMTNLL